MSVYMVPIESMYNLLNFLKSIYNLIWYHLMRLCDQYKTSYHHLTYSQLLEPVNTFTLQIQTKANGFSWCQSCEGSKYIDSNIFKSELSCTWNKLLASSQRRQICRRVLFGYFILTATLSYVHNIFLDPIGSLDFTFLTMGNV